MGGDISELLCLIVGTLEYPATAYDDGSYGYLLFFCGTASLVQCHAHIALVVYLAFVIHCCFLVYRWVCDGAEPDDVILRS